MLTRLRTFLIASVVLSFFAFGLSDARSAVPEAGDYDEDRKLDVDDIDLLTAAILAGETTPAFDLNENGVLDPDDRVVWVEELADTNFGDTNLNGVFNTGDLVKVFQAGEYEDQLTGNSTWATGDWNGDTEFGSGDLVLAFSSGAFEGPSQLPGPAGGTSVVPEPAGLALLNLGIMGLLIASRRLRR
jgi:hypothetical protein